MLVFTHVFILIHFTSFTLHSYFLTLDTTEYKLVQQTFELAKTVAELKLTESELALYSAFALISPGI